MIEYALIYLACLLVLRPLFNKLKYQLYLQYATFNDVEGLPQFQANYVSATQREDSPDFRKQGRFQNIHNLHGPNEDKESEDHFDQQLEGGSSDDDN